MQGSGFTELMMCCVITAMMANLKLFMHLANPAGFFRVFPVDLSIVN